MPRTYDARPDTLDFRDHMYAASLIEVPPRVPLESYREYGVPILDQGQEGACTGFGLATVAHYLLIRRRVDPDPTPVSPRMLYQMARRYDEWPGEDYEGSSARGAMKGWHKHGICAAALWPYAPGQADEHLNAVRVANAALRPLGAYARVNHRDLVCMHAALAEVGILYATAIVHRGWEEVGEDGRIRHLPDRLGGHAFAIVAYDERGFWIQNSWGEDWGRGGFAHLSYDDWLTNATDVWVARLGAPVRLETEEATAIINSASARHRENYSYSQLRPHIISIGNNGELRDTGPYGTSAAEVEEIVTRDFPRLTQGWPVKRLLLYAHGGLVPEETAVQRVADYRGPLLEAQVYPLAFSWKSDYWTTLTNILEDALRRRRPEGLLDAAKDFMLDRLDDALEPLTRVLTGKAQWDEMKENAQRATSSPVGGARLALQCLRRMIEAEGEVELHVVGHSAGAIFLAPLVRLLTSDGVIPSGLLQGERGLGLQVKSCTLWAPAITTELFHQTYVPALAEGGIERMSLFTLTDSVEQDDHCARIYNKSLLYLVSNALEARPRLPFQRDGVPLLGMERFIRQDEVLQELIASGRIEWVRSPNNEPVGSANAAGARAHGAFDDDPAVVRATLARVLAAESTDQRFRLHRSAGSLQDRRESLMR